MPDRAQERALAKRLTDQRRELHRLHGQRLYSQKRIADLISVKPGVLTSWESGKALPNRFIWWEAWARALGGEWTQNLQLPEAE